MRNAARTSATTRCSNGCGCACMVRGYSTQPVVKRTPYGAWGKRSYQQKFLKSLEPKLKINELSDWYNVTRIQVEKCGGSGLFEYYSSLEDALQAVYPEYSWETHRFVRGAFWRAKSNQMEALNKVEQQLGIAKPEDWSAVALTDLKEAGFLRTMTRRDLVQLLSEKYPQHDMNKILLGTGRFTKQKKLEKVVEHLFPEVEIITNARKEAGLVHPTTGAYMELDVYIPSLGLAFEYQEKHHYTSTEWVYVPLSVIKAKDDMKRELARAKNITLIIVPCWWDGRVDSLVSTIRQVRPDLLIDVNTKGEAHPIPEEAPEGFFKKEIPEVEGIGQPTTACFFTLSNVDPTNWWMFEKYDGVRGFWNPLKKKFYSRYGKEFNFPQEIIDSMPKDVFLDGELWFGREAFEEALQISGRAQLSNINWPKFKYMVFDIPNHGGIYKERYEALEKLVSNGEWKYLGLAERELCKDMTHLEQFFQDVIDKGGEGVILRDPNAPYQAGRSPGYLKHKKFRDAEARIVSVHEQHISRWECELPNGVRFTAPAGTTQFGRKGLPKVGDIVTFKHYGFLPSTFKPKLPTLHRIRTDITWDEVIANWQERKSKPFALPLRRQQSNVKPKGYWANKENRVKFFTEFAKDMGFDPSDYSKWKTISTTLFSAKQGQGLLLYYKGSLSAALADTFPGFEREAQRRPQGYWLNSDHRREYFTEFAKKKGFDPLSAENWEDITATEIKAQQGRGPLYLYKSLSEALKAAFPEHTKSQPATITPQ